MIAWTQEDIDAVYSTARARNDGAYTDGCIPHAGAPDEPDAELALHVLGCWGELAIAKELNIPWSRSVGQYDKRIPDVGIFHVRCRSRHFYELIIRPDDVDELFPYVLVTTEDPPADIEIRGWIRRPDARREEWWQTHGNRPGAWFVPHYALSMPL